MAFPPSSSSSIVTKNVFAFLEKIPPFQFWHGPYREDLERQLGNISLAALAEIYRLDFQEAHHALDDAFVTARLWQKMISKLEAMKVRTLGGALRIGKA